MKRLEIECFDVQINKVVCTYLLFGPVDLNCGGFARTSSDALRLCSLGFV